MKTLYNNIYKLFKAHGIIVLGFCMFVTYIYFRFIREKLPREIPFNLSILGFFILIELCLIYAYVVYRLIKPATTSNANIEIIVDFILKPLKDFDSYIKTFTLIKTYNEKCIIWLIYNYEYIFKTSIFDLIFLILPRLILINTFIIDIFYFHKLQYIYYALFIGIVLLLRKYIIYSIKALKDLYMKEVKLYVRNIQTPYVFGVHPSEWPENYDPEDEDNDEWVPSMSLPLDIYIEFYVKNKVYEDTIYPCEFIFMTKAFYEQYPMFNALGEIYQHRTLMIQEKIIEHNFHTMLQLNVLLEYYEKQSSHNNILRYIKIIINKIKEYETSIK